MGAFNGSGLFVRSFNWVQDKINGVNITASRCDQEDDGFAAGLSNCVTRDGQGQPAASIIPNADTSYDLGSASFRWRNIYLSGGFAAPIVIHGLVTLQNVSSVTPSGTPATLTAVPSSSNKIMVFLVTAGIPTSNDAVHYNCSAIVTTNGNSATITTLQPAGLLTLSLSGLILQGTQSSGGPAAITWTLVQLQ